MGAMKNVDPFIVHGIIILCEIMVTLSINANAIK